MFLLNQSSICLLVTFIEPPCLFSTPRIHLSTRFKFLLTFNRHMIDLSHINVALIVEWCLLRETLALTEVYCGATSRHSGKTIELWNLSAWSLIAVLNYRRQQDVLKRSWTWEDPQRWNFCSVCSHSVVTTWNYRFFFQNAFNACRHCSSRSYCVTTVTWERPFTSKDLKTFFIVKNIW